MFFYERLIGLPDHLRPLAIRAGGSVELYFVASIHTLPSR